MNIIEALAEWLTGPEQWAGPDSIPVRLVEHLYYSGLALGLAVIPLFLIMGQFAIHGGLSRALFRAAAAFIGHWRGGLGMAAVGACAGFGAICGSSLATAATMSQVALPELERHHYPPRLAAGTIAAGGTLGILIVLAVGLALIIPVRPDAPARSMRSGTES